MKNWAVSVEVNSEDVLIISNQHLSGIENAGDFDSEIKEAALSLLGFIGQGDGQEYQKYEFCRAEECPDLENPGTESEYCIIGDNYPCCSRTARHFHKWLKHNGYRIVKKSGNSEFVDHNPQNINDNAGCGAQDNGKEGA